MRESLLFFAFKANFIFARLPRRIADFIKMKYALEFAGARPIACPKKRNVGAGLVPAQSVHEDAKKEQPRKNTKGTRNIFMIYFVLFREISRLIS
jgi:hypothetical protein